MTDIVINLYNRGRRKKGMNMHMICDQDLLDKLRDLHFHKDLDQEDALFVKKLDTKVAIDLMCPNQEETERLLSIHLKYFEKQEKIK